MKLTLLGTGGSFGVPALGPMGWGACDPAEPRNRRTRCAALLEDAGRRLLVDCGPDIKPQLLAAGVGGIDALLVTHAHADHVDGLNELRAFAFERPGRMLDLHARAPVIDILARRFNYIFQDIGSPLYKPWVRTHLLDGPRASIAGFDLTLLDMDHTTCECLGFRIGNLAYCSDLIALSDAQMAQLEGLDDFVVEALGPEPHPSHAHLDLTLGWIERLKPRRAWLTHLGHRMDYASLCRDLPAHIRPAHDGLVIEMG